MGGVIEGMGKGERGKGIAGGRLIRALFSRSSAFRKEPVWLHSDEAKMTG